HQVMTQLQGRWILTLEMPALTRQRFKRCDPFLRRWVADLVRIDTDTGERHGATQSLEGFQHALCGLPGAFQICDGRAIGSGFFGALVAEEGAPCQFGATHQEARTGATKAVRARLSA